MEYPFLTKILNEEETIKLTESFSSTLKGGDVIVLNGNLGSGKTFFIKNALKNLNIKNVSSPTFSLINEYAGKFKVYHFDFYRINNKIELYDIGFDDYLNNENSIVFIEWGNLFPELLPSKRIEIEIKINEDFTREFEFKKYG